MMDLSYAGLREQAYAWYGENQTTFSEWTVDALTSAFIALRDAARAAHREADAMLLEDLARDMREDGTREQRALMRGGIAAYRSGAAAIRAQGETR